MKPWQVLLVVAAFIYLLVAVVPPGGLNSFFNFIGNIIEWFGAVFERLGS